MIINLSLSASAAGQTASINIIYLWFISFNSINLYQVYKVRCRFSTLALGLQILLCSLVFKQDKSQLPSCKKAAENRIGCPIPEKRKRTDQFLPYEHKSIKFKRKAGTAKHYIN